MADTYYCVKCKTKREMKDPQRVTMKNGKPALKGQCAVCGTTINKVLAQSLDALVERKAFQPPFISDG